jgi:hypothetical protein
MTYRNPDDNPMQDPADHNPMHQTRPGGSEIAGRCGARLRGDRAGQFCEAYPLKGKRRCRLHGGRAGARSGPRNGRWKDGARARKVTPLTPAEKRRRDDLRKEPFADIGFVFADARLLHERAVEFGNDEAAARHGAAVASLLRALRMSLDLIRPVVPDEPEDQTNLAQKLQDRPDLIPVVMPLLRQLDAAVNGGSLDPESGTQESAAVFLGGHAEVT